MPFSRRKFATLPFHVDFWPFPISSLLLWSHHTQIYIFGFDLLATRDGISEDLMSIADEGQGGVLAYGRTTTNRRIKVAYATVNVLYVADMQGWHDWDWPESGDKPRRNGRQRRLKPIDVTLPTERRKKRRPSVERSRATAVANIKSNLNVWIKCLLDFLRLPTHTKKRWNLVCLTNRKLIRTLIPYQRRDKPSEGIVAFHLWVSNPKEAF